MLVKCEMQEFLAVFIEKGKNMSCDLSELNKRIGVQDRVAFFEECQGGRAAAVIWAGWLVWESGSSRELVGGGWGRMQDASWYDTNEPQQMRELLSFKIRFCQQKLEDAITEFEAAKSEIKSRAQNAAVSGFQPPDKSELKQLRRLRHSVRQWEERLNELDAILNPPKEPYQYSEQEQKVMEENRNQADDVLSALDKLEV